MSAKRNLITLRFEFILKYITQNSVPWSYWAIDGTQSTGTGRVYGDEEYYGVYNLTWSGAASEELLQALQSIMIVY